MHSLPLTEIALRLFTAFVCGAVIGLNRDLRRKPAGVRTFGLVSIGSAVVTLAMTQIPGTDANAISRVIQGVLTGIGFLGAGVILHRDKLGKVAGLTTAAAVWLTAGLGVAAGAGLFAIVWLSLPLALIVLLLGGPLEHLFGKVLGHNAGSEPGTKDDNTPDS